MVGWSVVIDANVFLLSNDIAPPSPPPLPVLVLSKTRRMKSLHLVKPKDVRGGKTQRLPAVPICGYPGSTYIKMCVL